MSEFSDVKLEPCPFCKAPALWRPVTQECGVMFGIIVEHTDDCYLNYEITGRVPFDDMAARWNNRATSVPEHTDEHLAGDLEAAVSTPPIGKVISLNMSSLVHTTIGRLGATVPEAYSSEQMTMVALDMAERRILRLEMVLRRSGIDVELAELPQ